MKNLNLKIDKKLILGLGALALTFLGSKLTEKQEELDREEFKEEIKKEIFEEFNSSQSDGE